MQPPGIVTLTTDFGLADAYVAQLHAVILARHPQATVVDISHAVPLGRLDSALFLTESAWPHFPPGAIHLVVVDPGVGTDRRLVALQGPHAAYVGPDTGVLSSAFAPAARPSEPGNIPLPDGYQAIEITQSPVRAAAISPTFHGRDIMAPVAAHLARGDAFDTLGAPLAKIAIAPALTATDDTGRIIHIDHFGNAITNFRADDVPANVQLLATTGWRDEVAIHGLSTTYGDATSDQPILVAGGSGYLEIAWPNGDAAERLGLRLDDPLRLRVTSPGA